MVRGHQHGFYAGAFGTPSHFGNAGWPWYNFRSSGIVRFVQGGVAKTFRWSQTNGFVDCETYRNVPFPKLRTVSVIWSRQSCSQPRMLTVGRRSHG